MKERVAFGAFLFDVASARLWSGAREVRLTPKAGAVLKELIAHAGSPVSKDDLFDAVWDGIAVTDDALTSCIRELRRALEDDARQPRFIETRHRRGYQFVAPIGDAEPEEIADGPLPAPEMTASASIGRWTMSLRCRTKSRRAWRQRCGDSCSAGSSGRRCFAPCADRHRSPSDAQSRRPSLLPCP